MNRKDAGHVFFELFLLNTILGGPFTQTIDRDKRLCTGKLTSLS